jgi:multidrug efflux pump subunit AcrB
MNNFNLTDWALRHRAIVLFMLLIVAVAGAFSFTRLGQLEDPNFSVPSMTAMVIWPGATAQQLQDRSSTAWRKNSSRSITSRRW